MPWRRRFEVKAVMEPAGLFGVADGSMVLIPFRDEQDFTEKVWRKVRAGMDSIPKDSGDLVRVDFKKDDFEVSIIDNVVRFWVVAATPAFARADVDSFMRRLVQRLSVATNEAITYHLTELRDYEGLLRDLPQFKVIPFAIYESSSMKGLIERAVADDYKEDFVCARALDYYHHGELYLDLARRIHYDPRYREDAFGTFGEALVVTAFLSFWKAMTVILHEPGKQDKVDLRRVDALGLNSPEFLEMHETLRDLRNVFDVAHRSHSELSAKRARSYAVAVRVMAAEVIEAYTRVTANGAPSFSPTWEETVMEDQELKKKLKPFERPGLRSRHLQTGWVIEKSSSVGE